MAILIDKIKILDDIFGINFHIFSFILFNISTPFQKIKQKNNTINSLKIIM